MKTIYITAVLLLGAREIAMGVSDSGKEDSFYSSFGKRDPFLAPQTGSLARGDAAVDPLRKYRLEAYQLRAILRIGGKPKAMFEDPEGKSHVVMEGDRMGSEGARVSRIINSEVIVTEKGTNQLGKETLFEKVIALPTGTPNAPAVSGGVQQSFSGAGTMMPSLHAQSAPSGVSNAPAVPAAASNAAPVSDVAPVSPATEATAPALPSASSPGTEALMAPSAP